MANSDDFFNQLKGANDKLADIRTDVEQLTNIVSSNLLQLVTLTAYNAQALFQNALQNASIICILEKISSQTCELLNQSCLQTALQKEMEKHIAAISSIVAAAHPEAALILEREQSLRRELEKCCPPTPPKSCCHYEPCIAPQQIPPPPVGGVTGAEKKK
jgi:hypothetical protein